MVVTAVLRVCQVYGTEATAPASDGRKQANSDEGSIPGFICLLTDH